MTEVSIKTIEIQGKTRKTFVIDDKDQDLVCQYKWYLGGSRRRYVMGKKKGQQRYVMLHRLIMNPDADKVIDHINGDTLDNRRCNLRVTTQGKNIANRSALQNNKIEKTGVTKTKTGKYRVMISCGTFDTPEEASEAYKRVHIFIHGEYSVFSRRGSSPV